MLPERHRFDQFDTSHDFQNRCETQIDYAICSTPRSGSHYLGHLMYSTGNMGYPLEYFHPGHFKRWTELSGSERVPEVIQYIRSRRTSPNGCFGFKAHFPQFLDLERAVPIDSVFTDCKFILIDREDLVGQAVSLVRARQTGQWMSMHEAQGTPEYAFDLVDKAMLSLLAEKASWLRWFAVNAKPYLRITYEELQADPTVPLNRIARYFGLAEPVQIRVEDVVPQKQGTPENERWRERYREDASRRNSGCFSSELRFE